MTTTTDPDELQTDTAVVRALRKIRMPQRQRNRELALLIFAFAVVMAAVVLVMLGATGTVDPRFIAYVGVFFAMVLVLHIVLRLRARDADPFVVPIATLLTGIGIAEIYRIDIHWGRTGWASIGIKQIAWAIIALFLTILVVYLLRNYRVLFRYTYIFGLAGILLLLLPEIPGLSTPGTNANVWVTIPGLGSFQPGEIAKLCLGVFFAGYLVRTRESLTSTGKRFLGITWPRLRELGPVLVFWFASLGIIVMQHDLGTGLLIFGMFIAMLYVATGKTSWALIGVILLALGGYAASRLLPYVNARFQNWLDPFNPDTIQGSSYQITQGIFGMAQGGLIGTGLGEGRPWITPVAESDYIFASLGEELGLIGLFAILCLYMVFASRGIRIGLAGQDDFGRLLAVGLSFTVALQVFIMVGGVTRVIPLTGLTTPFLAAGGSSLVSNWLIVGLLLRISDAVRSRPRVVIG